MRKISVLVMAACMLLIAVPYAGAQPPPPPPDQMQNPPPPPPGMGTMDGPPPPDFGESRELMEQVMVTRLTRNLGLNDEQSLILMRRFAEMREQRQTLQRERMEVMRDLRNVIKEEKDEGALTELMERLKHLDNRSRDMEMESRNAVEGLDLNVWQRAKIELFMSDFQNEMRRVLQQVQGNRGPHGPMMGDPDMPGPPYGPRMGDPNAPCPMMGDPDMPGPPPGPMMGNPQGPRGPGAPGDAMRRPRGNGPGQGPGPGQRPPNMPNRPRRSGPPEPPPAPPAQ